MWVWFTCRLFQCRSHLLMHSKVGRAASSRTRCLSSGRCRLSRSIGDSRPSRRQQGSSVERRRSTQRGQAIVLIGIMVAVVVGMAALAVDGARAYALRRDLQAATDAAALAAADNYQQYRNYIAAETAATTSFGQNIRLDVRPSCSPTYGAPPRTITCTYADHSVLTETVTAL